jgi:hypothetical protein
MQIANKVRKKMEMEYGGLYETFTATAGQTVFDTTGKFSTQGHVLKVYVDGVLAIKDVDYAIQDDNTIVFVEGLTEGAIVLITTEVVGIPKFTVYNPPYDDTELRTKIGQVIAALDEDGDGSIFDTIANIKAQWEAADGSLQTLIASKVEQAVVDLVIEEITNARGGRTTLKARLDEIVSMIPAPYDDTLVKSDISSLQGDVTAATNAISIAQTNITNLQTSMGLATTDIEDLKTKVSAINTVLDEDTDGSILDALVDLKTQWEAADGNLQSLINNKAEASDLQALETRVDANESNITQLTNDMAGKAAASDVEALETRVAGVENRNLSQFVLLDSVTGRKFKLELSSGTLSAVLNQTIMTASITAPAYVVNTAQEFTVDTVANEDVGALVKAHFTIPAGATLEYYRVSDDTWQPLADVFGPAEGFALDTQTLRFRATFSAEGTYDITVDFKKVDNSAVLGTVTQTFTVTTV